MVAYPCHTGAYKAISNGGGLMEPFLLGDFCLLLSHQLLGAHLKIPTAPKLRLSKKVHLYRHPAT